MTLNRMARIAMLALAATLATHAKADTPPDFYDLVIEISHQGESLGQPRLLVAPGKQAEVLIEQDGGGFRLRTVARHGNRDGQPVVEISTDLARREGGKWRIVARPAVVAKPGEQAVLSVGGEEAGSPPVLTMKLRATPVSRAQVESEKEKWRAAEEDN